MKKKIRQPGHTPVSMMLPNALDLRLTAMSKATGRSRKWIIVSALTSELNSRKLSRAEKAAYKLNEETQTP